MDPKRFAKRAASLMVSRQDLPGLKVDLRPLVLPDANALDHILRDRQVTQMLPLRVQHETGRQFVTRVLREQRRGEGPAFAVRPRGSEEVIGQIRFVNWSRSEGVAEVGYWIRRKCWGKGFGTEALRLICRFGFRSLGLQRIEANVIEGNVRSQRILVKVGFRPQGRRRRATRLSGKRVDGLLYGLLRGELRGL